MGVPFYNCPTKGEDVVVSVDQIIGGQEGAGQGWKMLMECLGIGRSISLPAQAAGGAKVATRTVGAYSAIRKQFGLEIGKFEGIEEPMARIGGLTYLVEASRIFGVGAVDKGLKPAVSSAIAKYNTTELARIMINDAMDILGGAAISRGPRNILANMYVAAPIGITVEGANILTRTLIIFGQGAIRCHPYAFSELTALMEGDAGKFDKYFFKHIGFALRNTCRSLLLSLTRGHLARVPSGPMKKYYRKLAWSSATFAFMADLALGSYGGGLKMKEKLSGRYADVLSWMYLITATLHRFEAEGRRKDHEVFVTYACEYGFAKIQEAFDGIFANIEIPLLTKLFRGPVLLWHRLNSLGRMPSDDVTAKIAREMMIPGELRDSLTWGVYLSGDKEDNLGRYEHTLTLVTEAAAIYKKIYKAVKAKKLPKGKPHLLVDQALEAGVITADEAKLAKDAEEARNDAVLVDSFDVENFKTNLLEEDKQA
jgi:acyl-CoA dehydrogenase